MYLYLEYINEEQNTLVIRINEFIKLFGSWLFHPLRRKNNHIKFVTLINIINLEYTENLCDELSVIIFVDKKIFCEKSYIMLLV